MTIKEKLIKANRYTGIIKILESIVRSKQDTFVVDPFVKDNKEYTLIDAHRVKLEAEDLLKALKVDQVVYVNPDYELLYKMVDSVTNTRCKNYTKAVAYHCEPVDYDLEETRDWLILQSLIISLIGSDDIEELNEWEIDSKLFKEADPAGLKHKLQKAGRYDITLTMLRDIASTVEDSFYVGIYEDSDDITTCFVRGDNVRKEAVYVLHALEEDSSLTWKPLNNLYKYIVERTNSFSKDCVERLIRNVDVSDASLDCIRRWTLLQSMIEKIVYDSASIDSWEIPEYLERK